MRPILTLLLAAGLVVPAVALAQPGAPPGPGGRMGPGHHRPAPFPGDEDPEALASERLDILADYLELSEAQRYEIEAILDEGRAERRDGFEAMRGAADELHDLLESEPPDATRIGEIVISLHRQKESLAAARSAEHDAIAALLTPEQRERFEALEAARDLAPGPFEPRPFGPHRPGRHSPPPPDTPGAP